MCGRVDVGGMGGCECVNGWVSGCGWGGRV